jgi:hypothetical protein
VELGRPHQPRLLRLLAAAAANAAVDVAVDVVVAAGGRGVAVGLVTFGVVVVPGRNLG